SVSGFSLTPANGTVAVAAPPGFLVSAAGGTEYASLLSVPYTNGNLSTTTISVKFIPASVQLYTGAITFSLGGSQVQTLPVDGNSLRVPEGSLTAKATWALLNSQAPVDSGNIYSENQSLINLSGISYNSTFGGISGWQRAATTSYLPTLSDTSKYIEYKTAPQAGSSFLVNSVSLNVLGGGSSNGRCAVYYSLDNFVSSTPLGTAAYNSSTYAATLTSPIVLLNTSTAGLTGQQIATFSPTIVVKNGQTLSIRLFAWCTSASKYFTSKNMCISGTTSLDTVSSTSVGGTAPSAPQRPVSYRLFQNYPNPFNPVTTIRFDLPERSSIALEIFDLMGKRITVAAEGSWPAGSYSIRFNAERLSSSIYIYKLTTDRGVLFQKMLLIK
ncbi:MAG: T9SS C-terminal target domain-containing protein, partial [Ignavibacteriae bacterium]